MANREVHMGGLEPPSGDRDMTERRPRLQSKGSNVTVNMPPELKERMHNFRWINWSEICRMAIRKKLDQLEAEP